MNPSLQRLVTESQKEFYKITSDTNAFTNCFEDETPLLEQISKWRQVLKTYCSKAYKKIRIRKKPIKPLKQPMASLINERNAISKEEETPEIKRKIDELSKQIFEIEAEDNRNKIMKNFKQFSDNPENINMQQMWKNLKRIWPKTGYSLPVAKKNHKGKIVTGPKDLKILLAREYKDRLRSRPVRPDLDALRKRRRRLFKKKMEMAQKRTSPDWTMDDLDLALSNLKKQQV